MRKIRKIKFNFLYILILAMMSSVLFTACGKSSKKDETIEVEVVDSGKDTSQNEVTKQGESKKSDETNETSDTSSDDTDDKYVDSIYTEPGEEDYLLGGWSTVDYQMYIFDNNGIFSVYYPSTDEIVGGTYETDGKTYVTINTDRDGSNTYTLTTGVVLNDYGEEVKTATLVKGDISIILNKQYEIRKLSDNI